MKQNWKRTLQGALLGAALLAMAGCGSNNVMDTYSFGHQVIRVGQSEITIALSYEMGKSTKNMTDDGYPIDIYGASLASCLMCTGGTGRSGRPASVSDRPIASLTPEARSTSCQSKVEE